MFDIAFSELVVIGIVMLVVIGPKRLPEVARSAGRWAGRIRRFVDDVKRDMDVELRKDELAELRKVKDQLTETRQLFEQTASSTFESIASIRPVEESNANGAASIPAPPKKTPAPKVRKPASAKSRKKKSSTRVSRTPSSTSHGRARRKRR